MDETIKMHKNEDKNPLFPFPIPYKSPALTDNSIMTTQTRRSIDMKATDIMRRTDARIIITQKCDKTL